MDRSDPDCWGDRRLALFCSTELRSSGIGDGRVGHHCLAWRPFYPVLAWWSISIDLSALIAMSPFSNGSSTISSPVSPCKESSRSRRLGWLQTFNAREDNSQAARLVVTAFGIFGDHLQPTDHLIAMSDQSRLPPREPLPSRRLLALFPIRLRNSGVYALRQLGRPGSRGIHRCELPASQNDHARSQAAATGDPTSDLRWIHRKKIAGRCRVWNSTSPPPEIPSCVESEIGIRRYTDSVVRDRAEDNCAG